MKRFTAKTIDDCLKLMRQEMGEQAHIVQQREYDKPILLGLMRRRVAEVTAAQDVDTQQERVNELLELSRRTREQRSGAAPAADPAAPAAGATAHVNAVQEAILPPTGEDDDAPAQADSDAAAANAERSVEDVYALLRQHTAQQKAPAPVSIEADEPAGPLTDSPPRGDLGEELAELRGMLRTLSDRFEEMMPVVFGEPFDALHRRLVLEGVSRPVANRLVAELSDCELPADEDAREDALLEALAEYLTTSGPVELAPEEERTGPKFVVLVGPTGMGKTTTLAKLAAEFKLYGQHQIRFITTDTYRLAAKDQLQNYADIMHVKLDAVYEPGEILGVLQEESDADLVLIDTAGCSQYNRPQLSSLQRFLQELPDPEVHLVIAANTRAEDMLEIYQQFSSLPITRLLLTKLDETTTYGSILTLQRQTHLPVSYITIGQTVPEDIEVATPRSLAELIYGTRRLVERDEEPVDEPADEPDTAEAALTEADAQADAVTPDDEESDA